MKGRKKIHGVLLAAGVLVVLLTIFFTGRVANPYAGCDFDRYIQLANYKDLGEGEDLWTRVYQESKMKTDKENEELYPKGALTRAREQANLPYILAAKNEKMELEEYLREVLGMEQSAYNAQMEAFAKATVKGELITFAIAEKEDIHVSKKEVEKFLAENFNNRGMEKEDMRAMDKEEIVKQLYFSKVVDRMIQEKKD
ncbi:MAG: hypothetical protein RR626_05635 [Anaerovoracaceae bacterium]